MAFHIKYFGKTNPDEDDTARPLGEWTWDKLPMDQTPYVDWKTGTVRSPLFNDRKPVEIPKAELDIPDFGDAGGGNLPAAQHAGSILYWVPADSTTNPPTEAHWQPMDDAATTNWGSGQLLVWDDVQKKWKFSFTPWSGNHNGQVLYWHSSDRNWHLSQPLTGAGQLIYWKPGSDHDSPEFVPIAAPSGSGQILLWDNADKAWKLTAAPSANGQALVWDSTNKTWTLCASELQSVVTGVQYDTTNHQIQIKTRQIRALTVPNQAESEFAAIPGGQAETYP